MGPNDDIGSNGCIYRWAHSIPSPATAAYANGPIRSHRQLQLHMPMGPHETIGNNSCIFQWAQTKLSAAPVGKLMGPCEAIDSNGCICQWAHAIPSATAAAYSNGPIRTHRQLQLHMPMGPFDPIASYSCICRWAHSEPLHSSLDGPTRNVRTFSFNGPTWAFPSPSVKMHVGFNDYYGINLLHGLSC